MNVEEEKYLLNYSEEDLLALAKKRIKLKRNMYSHIASYLVVNSFLVFVYFVTGDHSDDGIPWIIWPLAGWGVGLILDILSTVTDLRLTHDTKAVNKELEKIKRSMDK